MAAVAPEYGVLPVRLSLSVARLSWRLNAFIGMQAFCPKRAALGLDEGVFGGLFGVAEIHHNPVGVGSEAGPPQGELTALIDAERERRIYPRSRLIESRNDLRRPRRATDSHH